MNKTSLLALMVLVSATGLSAKDNDKKNDSNSSTSEQQDAAKKPKEKMICHSEPVTGSRTQVNRICHTKAEWDEIAQQARRDINNLDRNANAGNGPTNPLGPS